ncbi:hypothetical protein [Rhodanobacter thiooxydans]|uniref:hypothetical protein n=1 Tax=Rhodanobacter thiooxydans TaxID=416169 RepID=UPI000260E6CF|nr:hypothetical protein [Rhodanobacter thiooxydans]EIM00592.1 hypothetical protein UUA_06609 [Rhodanobacter thiooxydans LCS2]
MDRYTKLLLAIFLAATSAASAASVTSAEEFLLTKAAADFHKTSPNEIIHVRHVRFGQAINSENGKQDVLCGEFKSSGKTGKHWISFATTKSRYQSPGAGNYEQWIGAQAEVVCKMRNVTENDDKDLSSMLQQRLDHFTKKP